MSTQIQLTQSDGFNENSLNAFNIQIPMVNKVNGSDISHSPKIYTNPLNHQKAPESDIVSPLGTQQLTEKENGNYLDANNLKSPTSSEVCMNLQNEPFPSLTGTKLRDMDNEELKGFQGSMSENGIKSQPWEQASGMAQCSKELDEELEMITDHWKKVFSDVGNFEKSCFEILDGLIEKAEDLEKSWKMQKEMLGQRLKNLSQTFQL